MKYSNKQKGFTLVQLMATLFILSVILAASAPMITRAYKKIPTRAVHGMYICYYGNGGLTEEYYNAKTRISHNVVSGNQCKFVPPKQVASFEVELIGGGGGGAYHAAIEEIMPEEMVAKSFMGGGLNGNYVVTPKEEIYKRVFDGAETTTCAATGSGGSGGDGDGAYVSPSVTCYGTNGNGDKIDWSAYGERQYLRYGEGDDVCQKRADSHNESATPAPTDDNPKPTIKPEDKWIYSNNYESNTYTTYAPGLRGTPNSYFCVSETINVPEGKTVSSHLSTVMSKTAYGSASNSSCAGFSQTYPGTGTNGSDRGNTESSHIDSQGEYGSGVERYAAVKTYPTGCTVADSRPVGGDGGDLEFYDGFIYKNEGRKDEEPLYNTSDLTDYPTMVVRSKFNERHYTFGTAGSPGSYERAVVASIPAGCDITIGRGGSAGSKLTDKQKEELEDAISINDTETINRLKYVTHGSGGGDTSISCPAHGNIEAFSLQASGGGGSGSTQKVERKIYPLLGNDIYRSLANNTLSAGGGGSSSEYSPEKNVFTKYKNTPNHTNFGSAGSGTTIIDNLIGAQGYIRYYLDYDLKDESIVTGNEREYLEEEKDGEQSITNDVIMKHAKITGPSSGSAGALIITW